MNLDRVLDHGDRLPRYEFAGADGSTWSTDAHLAADRDSDPRLSNPRLSNPRSVSGGQFDDSGTHDSSGAGGHAEAGDRAEAGGSAQAGGGAGAVPLMLILHRHLA